MSLRKSIQLGQWRLPEKTRGCPRRTASFSLNFLNLAQCLAKLVRAGSRSVSTSDSFEFLDDIFHLHSLDQSTNSLKVSVTSSPKKDFGDYTILYFKFDVTTASTLRLVSQFLYHYSSAGFMLV